MHAHTVKTVRKTVACHIYVQQFRNVIPHTDNVILKRSEVAVNYDLHKLVRNNFDNFTAGEGDKVDWRKIV